ncbi:MAG: zinc ribbon domain-containing protein [Chloroflexi bacterium]|nr:zinc ribbon domain-containing protein [Chloroflexota bacterium]
MELGAIFLILAVLILVGMYLYAPFMSRGRRATANESHEVSSLMAERDRVINSLQELDFDFNLGKIPSEDYPAQRALLLQKGAEILKKLDELSLALTPSLLRQAQDNASPAGRGGSEEDRIEKAVAARRADASAETPQLTDDDIESMLAARRRAHKDKSAGFCPKCGKPIFVSDRFCPACGKSLT